MTNKRARVLPFVQPSNTAEFKTQREHAMLKAVRTSTTLFNSQLFASRTAPPSLALRVGARAARTYATETALPSTSSANPVTSVGKSKKDGVPDGPLRPQLDVEVNPNHGLWAFFRKKVGKDGVQSYETLEAKDNVVDYSGTFLFMALFFASRPLVLSSLSFHTGRAWSAAELRRKSFKDLHTLWYVVLRERNLLETQQLEMKRLGVLLDLTSIKQHVFRVNFSPSEPTPSLHFIPVL